MHIYRSKMSVDTQAILSLEAPSFPRLLYMNRKSSGDPVPTVTLTWI